MQKMVLFMKMKKYTEVAKVPALFICLATLMAGCEQTAPVRERTVTRYYYKTRRYDSLPIVAERREVYVVPGKVVFRPAYQYYDPMSREWLRPYPWGRANLVE